MKQLLPSLLVVGLCQARWVETRGPEGRDILSLAVSGGNLFAGTRDSGLYRSEDEGSTWRDIRMGTSRSSVPFLAGIAGTLFAAGAEGLVRSQDNGKNWSKVTLASGGPCEAGISALATRKGVLIAGTEGCGIFRSLDDGITWTAVPAAPALERTRALVACGLHVFAAAYPGGVFRSKDNGATWAAGNRGLSELSVTALVSAGLTLFAGTDGGGLFRSEDHGETWVKISGAWKGASIRALATSGDNIIAVVKGEGVFRSADNGATWTDANAGVPSPDPTALAAYGTTLFAGTHGFGVWKFPLPPIEPPRLRHESPDRSIMAW